MTIAYIRYWILFIFNLVIVLALLWLTNELINSTGVSPLQSINEGSYSLCPSVNPSVNFFVNDVPVSNFPSCLGYREISLKQALASWLVIIAWGSYLVDLLMMGIMLYKNYKKKVYYLTIPFVLLLGLRAANSIAVLFIIKPWLPSV